MKKIIAYVNSIDIGGNQVRHELQMSENWNGEPYYFLVDAYYNNGKRLCENLRGFHNYHEIMDGIKALEMVSGAKLAPEFVSLICGLKEQKHQLS